MGATKIKTKIDKEDVGGGQVEVKEKKSEVKKVLKVRGKNYKEAKALIDRDKKYEVVEAVKLAKKVSFSKFIGSLELHMLVNKEGISVEVELPHGSGKERIIEVADEKTLVKLEKGVIDFDILLTTAEMMPNLVKYARLLGPRGLMPNPKNGTIIKDSKDAGKFMGNKMRIKTEKKAPVIHMVLGKMDMEDEKLVENLEAVLTALGKNRILKAYIAPSMGPSIKLSV